MKKFLFLLMIIYHSYYSQNVYSEFEVISSKNVIFKNLPKTHLKDLDEVFEMMGSNDITVKTKMEVISNSRYSFIKINFKDINFFVGSDENPKADLYLIDFDKEIGYNINEKKFFKCKSYSVPVKSEKDTTYEQIFINKSDTAFITFNKRLPKYVKSRIPIKNNIGGISLIITKKEIIMLQSFKNNIKFDFEKFVEDVKKICVLDGGEIDLLFIH